MARGTDIDSSLAQLFSLLAAGSTDDDSAAAVLATQARHAVAQSLVETPGAMVALLVMPLRIVAQLWQFHEAADAIRTVPQWQTILTALSKEPKFVSYIIGNNQVSFCPTIAISVCSSFPCHSRNMSTRIGLPPSTVPGPAWRLAHLLAASASPGCCGCRAARRGS